jgi:hypothetical protein
MLRFRLHQHGGISEPREIPRNFSKPANCSAIYTTQQFTTDEEAEKMLANHEESWKIIRVLPIAPADKKKN